MALTENLKNVAINVQQAAKDTTVSTAQKLLRLISGVFIGLVLAIIIQVLTQSGDLMLVFVTTLLTAIIYKLLARLQIVQILIFDLICILIAALLRMYIMIAP